MISRIGYLAPEFPGQTHAFFWRETRALQDLGVEAKFISTKRPPSQMVVHDWAAEAQEKTEYVAPFSPGDMFGVLSELFRAGPVKIAHCVRLAVTAQDCGMAERAKLCAMIPVAAKLARIMRQDDVEHLHVQSCANSANLAMFAALLSGIPYSLSLLGPTLELYGKNQRNKWRHAAFAVVMSELLLDVVKKRLADDLPPVVDIVPVGVDLEEMRRKQPYRPWKKGDECRIYSCGRLNAIKGHDHLIESVMLLRDRGISCKLAIAGEDEQGGTGYRRFLEKRIRDRGAEAFVELLGAISESAHREQLARAHIFALASENEGISVAIMEAMAMQTPVVVTDVGGNSELIVNGQNGIMVSYGNHGEMADAIERVLQHPEEAIRLSGSSRQRVIEKFDAKATAAKLIDCLERSRANFTQPVPEADLGLAR